MESFEVFEEWDIYAKKKELLNRHIDFPSIIKNSEMKIIAITGIRRSGKTSVLMLLAQRLASQGKKVCYINLEDSRLNDKKNVLDDAIKWFGDHGIMLLDEITNVPGWEGWLARTHELLKGKLRLIISSSRKNIMQPQKPLRGRILPYELYPLSFPEFLSFIDVKVEKTTSGKGRLEKAFFTYLKYGGFPEVALTKNETDKILILNSYFRDIIGLDIAEMSHEDISIVETFGRYVIQSPYFSASKCLNFLKTVGHKIGKEKILQLEHYAQAGNLFFFVSIFSYSIKDRLQYPRKAYCGDGGFLYSISGKMDMGRFFENLVFLELKRRTQGQKEICYWKNKTGLETDFVVKQGTTIHNIIQVVYDVENEETMKREISGLVKCAEELGIKQGLILTSTTHELKTINGIRIKFIPLSQWILNE